MWNEKEADKASNHDRLKIFIFMWDRMNCPSWETQHWLTATCSHYVICTIWCFGEMFANDARKSNSVSLSLTAYFLICCIKVPRWAPKHRDFPQECIISNQYKCSVLIEYKMIIGGYLSFFPAPFHWLERGLSTKLAYLNQYIPHYRVMNISSPRLLLQMNNLTVLYQSGLGGGSAIPWSLSF